MKGCIPSEGLAREGIHCAGILKDRKVELLVSRVEVQSCRSHTNHFSTLETMAQRR
jgi:hypothetical protein